VSDVSKDLYHVTLLPEGRTFSVRSDESILDAALHLGINLPHSCKGGSCSSCRARVVNASITYPFGRPAGITPEEEQHGFALLCEARPASNVSVQIREIRLADDVEIKDLPCRIARKELLAPDVMALFLQLPAIETFHFIAGQYLDVMLPGERRRSFSIASPPHDSGLLELHLYWGARTAPDLYQHGLASEWAARYPNFSYTPVLSDLPPADPWPGRRGPVHEAAFVDYPDLRGIDVYASGPPALIDAIRHDGASRGLEPERLHFDSFEYSPDALAKMRGKNIERATGANRRCPRAAGNVAA